MLPPRLPSHQLVQTLRYMTRPLDLIEECQRCLGDIFTLPILGMGNLVLLTTPQDIKSLFTANSDVLSGSIANKAIFGVFAGQESSLVLDGETHLRRRRLILPPFHGDRMRVYTDVIREITERTVAAWPHGTAFAVQPFMQDIAVQIIINTVFGLQHGNESQTLSKLLRKLADIGLDSPLFFIPALQKDLGKYSPWGRILHLLRQVDEALYAEIRRRRSEPRDESKQDILSRLLSVKDEDNNPISDQALRDELITMLLAGHETTGVLLAWALERIYSEPEVLRTIEEERQRVAGGGPLQEAHFGQLPYLDATIKEVLRFRPPAPIGGSRVVLKPFELGPYTLPPGTLLTNCMYLLMRRPELYPQPEKFQPERFLNKKENPYEWTPFGGGVRRCPGMALALYEAKVVLTTILSRVRLRLEKSNLRMVRRGWFLAPEGGMRVIRMPN